MTTMNHHDTTHSEACRLARYAARARAAGDIQSAERFEARALSLVEGRPVRHESRVRVLGRAIAVVTGLVVLSLAGTAQAANGPKKPSVCAAFKVIESEGKAYGVCSDGKRPKLYSSWRIVEVIEPESGAVVRVAVGF
jgi:hypothetical protein